MTTQEIAVGGYSKGFSQTHRTDRWWIGPLLTFLGFSSFIVYSTWAALQGNHYFYGSYLSPFYSPLLFVDPSVTGGASLEHAWFGGWPSWWPSFVPASPAFLVLAFPGAFRFTCYYYRKAYYRAFAFTPPGCAVTALPQKNYKNLYLINNASLLEPIGPAGKVNTVELTRLASVNFLNYAVIINEFMRRTKNLRARKRILNVTSGASVHPQYGLAGYCSTKAALEMFGSCIFLEQQVLNQVEIMSFRPGVINTDMQKKLRESSGANFLNNKVHQELYTKNALLTPEYVAKIMYGTLTARKKWAEPILDLSI